MKRILPALSAIHLRASIEVRVKSGCDSGNRGRLGEGSSEGRSNRVGHRQGRARSGRLPRDQVLDGMWKRGLRSYFYRLKGKYWGNTLLIREGEECV